MSLFSWVARRSGGLAMVLLTSFCCWIVLREAAARFKREYSPQENIGALPNVPTVAGIWTVLFAWYCLFIHVLMFSFPLRACWAIWDITGSLRRVARKNMSRNSKSAPSSISSGKTLAVSRSSPSEANEGDFDKTEGSAGADIVSDRIIHVIIIPNYKEETNTLRETLDVLASHSQAHSNYDIYLAMEKRERNAEDKALLLISEFVKKFRSIDFTLHPSGIPGECPGKGSNVDWAAHRLSDRYPLGVRKDVIVTGIDADSHLSTDYFALITKMHQAYPETATTTLYSAPIIFDRNSQSVPAVVRVADILWCAAGISGLYRGSLISPPTSVYSLPLQLVDRVGGWDCNSEAIGEDLHMYLKCFFALKGNLTVRTVLSPVSQSNVTAGGFGKGMHGLTADMRARFKQAQRHMWGSLDSGYALRKAVELWQGRNTTTYVFRPLHSSLRESTNMYVPDLPSESLKSNSNGGGLVIGIDSDVTHDTLKRPDYERLFYLFHRLFEAHFLPVQMTIFVVASTLYAWATNDTADFYGIAWIFRLSKYLGAAGFLLVTFYLFLYETFHEMAVSLREREMQEAGLAKGMHFSHRDFKKNFVDYLLVPIVAPLYGAIPCAQAQICHFWTVELVYTVSGKATRQRTKSTSAVAVA